MADPIDPNFAQSMAVTWFIVTSNTAGTAVGQSIVVWELMDKGTISRKGRSRAKRTFWCRRQDLPTIANSLLPAVASNQSSGFGVFNQPWGHPLIEWCLVESIDYTMIPDSLGLTNTNTTDNTQGTFPYVTTSKYQIDVNYASQDYQADTTGTLVIDTGSETFPIPYSAPCFSYSENDNPASNNGALNNPVALQDTPPLRFVSQTIRFERKNQLSIPFAQMIAAQLAPVNNAAIALTTAGVTTGATYAAGYLKYEASSCLYHGAAGTSPCWDITHHFTARAIPWNNIIAPQGVTPGPDGISIPIYRQNSANGIYLTSDLTVLFN